MIAVPANWLSQGLIWINEMLLNRDPKIVPESVPEEPELVDQVPSTAFPFWDKLIVMVTESDGYVDFSVKRTVALPL